MTVLKELLEPGKPPSEKDHKKMMAALWTVRSNSVKACGHKFFEEREPRQQCPNCWAAFFFINGQISALADEVYQKEGKEMLIKIKGRRFTKWFCRFMNEIQKKLEAKIEENGNK